MRSREHKQAKQFFGVEIIDTADEGLAIGRCTDGLIIQVRGGVPGDRLDVVVTEKRKGMYIARATSVTSFSPDRADPFCSHFGTCGGCKWQHMSYEAQLRYKEKKVIDSFQRIGGLDTTLIKPIVGASQQKYYRNKMEFTASDRRWLTTEELNHTDETLPRNGIGFHLVASFDKVLDIEHCYLQADPSNAIRHHVKQLCIDHQWPFLNLRNKSGFIRNVIIRNNLEGRVMVILVVGEDDSEKVKILVRSLVQTFPEISSVFPVTITK